MLAYYYTTCAEKAFKASVRRSLLAITLAFIAIATVNDDYVSIFLGCFSIVCFLLAAIAAIDMLNLDRMSRHERNRESAHLNPRRIYL